MVGRSIWPLSRTVDLSGAEPGVRVRYHDVNGVVRYAIVSAASFTNRTDQMREGQRVAELGVQIATGRGQQLIEAIGHWYDKPTVDRVGTTVRKPGWHTVNGRRVYANGDRVYGAPFLFNGPPERNKRAGDLYAWIEQAMELARTVVAVLVLGMAFAGPLLRFLGVEGFGLHLSGRSSTGKTLLAKLGLTVWCDPEDFLTWNGTKNGFEHKLSKFNDAFLLLDEIKEANPATVAQLAHAISDGVGRVRSNQPGTDNLKTRTWRIALVSTGETTVSDYLGANAQGGQSVRLIDVPVEAGEACVDADHAARVESFIEDRRQFGTAGDAWAQYLVDLDESGRVRLKEALGAHRSRLRAIADSDPELGRIAAKLALLETALNEAHRAGLLPSVPPERAEEVVTWALAAIRCERGSAVSPETRALALLRQSLVAEPLRWPHEDDYDKAQAVIGVRPDRRERDQVWVCEGMLKKCGLLTAAGVSARRFLQWAVKEGFAKKLPKGRIAGAQRNWYRLDFAHKPGNGPTDDVEDG